MLTSTWTDRIASSARGLAADVLSPSGAEVTGDVRGILARNDKAGLLSRRNTVQAEAASVKYGASHTAKPERSLVVIEDEEWRMFDSPRESLVGSGEQAERLRLEERWRAPRESDQKSTRHHRTAHPDTDSRDLGDARSYSAMEMGTYTWTKTWTKVEVLQTVPAAEEHEEKGSKVIRRVRQVERHLIHSGDAQQQAHLYKLQADLRPVQVQQAQQLATRRLASTRQQTRLSAQQQTSHSSAQQSAQKSQQHPHHKQHPPHHTHPHAQRKTTSQQPETQAPDLSLPDFYCPYRPCRQVLSSMQFGVVAWPAEDRAEGDVASLRLGDAREEKSWMCVHDGCLAVFDEAEDWRAHVLGGGHHDLLMARGADENEGGGGEMNETEEE